MTPRRSDDDWVRSIAARKALMVASGVLIFAGFIPVILHHKGFIDIESFGVPENYLYIGGLAAGFIGLISIFVVWRCPSCNAYLGKDANPLRCPKCEVRFR